MDYPGILGYNIAYVKRLGMDIAEAKVERSFGWLNATQFLGALNDNIFKLLIIAFIIGIRGMESASNVTALAGVVFVVPFLLFSAYAGKLADRFSKRNIIVVVKCAEVLVMTLGFAGFIVLAISLSIKLNTLRKMKEVSFRF